MGFAVLLVLLAFLTSIGLKLLPIYMEHFNVKSILDNLVKEGRDLTAEEVKPRILKNFILNDVTNVDRQHIKVKRKTSKLTLVTIDYEVRRKMIANVDVVIHFNDSVELIN